MKTCKLTATIYILLFLASGIVTSNAWAQNQKHATVPRLVQFSGTIKDSAGKPASGNLSLTFALYQEEDGGTPLWVETQSVQADAGGHYTVFLGANSEGLPLDVLVGRAARAAGSERAAPDTARRRALRPEGGGC